MSSEIKPQVNPVSESFFVLFLSFMGTDHNVDAHTAADSPGSSFRLNSDILWLIFIINTALDSHYGHDRLTTARSCSQVCRRWRQIFLSSSTLWARLIDLDHLYFNNTNDVNNWRNEVLLRSGSSLLWIQGNVNSRTHAFFCSFLDQNWTRIQRVDISEGDKSISYSTSQTTAWDGLERLAPHLQAFNISHTGSSRLLPRLVQDPVKFCSLFKAGAPVLEELSVPGIKFNTANCSWLASLRRIVLSYIFPIPEIFEIISQTSLLESLEISGKVGRGRQINPSFEIYTDLPTPHLPRLSEMTVRAHFTVALPFLERISFGESCRLCLVLKDDFAWIGRRNANVDAMELETDKLQVIRRRAMSHLASHLATRSVTRVFLDCQKDYLIFSVYTDFERSPSLSINGSFGQGSGPEILEEILLSEGLSRIREMSMYIKDCQSVTSRISHFPSVLRSLRVLQTSEDTLEYFLKSTSPSCASFPSLETLKLTQLDSGFPRLLYSSRVIRNFFQWQNAGGPPISVFDLTAIPCHVLYDMDYLDAVVGLKTVRWIFPDEGAVEYECGSGCPERLQFRRNMPSGRAEELRGVFDD